MRIVDALTAAGKSNWQGLSLGRGSGSMSREGGSLKENSSCDTCVAFTRTMSTEPTAKAKPDQAWLMQGPCGESEKNCHVSCKKMGRVVLRVLVFEIPSFLRTVRVGVGRECSSTAVGVGVPEI